MTEPKIESKTYRGGCHCGKVRFEVELALGELAACNCSICSRRGWLLAFAPKSAFRLLEGEDAMTDYQFHERAVHHLFCSTCGVSSWTWGVTKTGAEMVTVNARCLDDVEFEKLPVKHYDGKHL
jgi:hypothetical protein